MVVVESIVGLYVSLENEFLWYRCPSMQKSMKVILFHYQEPCLFQTEEVRRALYCSLGIQQIRRA